MIRRKFVTGLTMSTTALAFGNVLQPFSKRNGNKPLQLVQITDTHVFDNRDCPRYMELFFDKLSEVAPEPDLIFHSGDVIMDALYDVGRTEVDNQWKLWHSLTGQLQTKINYAIGNHDIWGQGAKSDPMYGKKWAMDEMELESRFYSFSVGPWKFIFLDSTQVFNGEWYTAQVDGEQKEWLKQELTQTSKDSYIMVVSHIPILSTCIFDWARNENNLWSVSGGLMHSDSHEIQALLYTFPQVKLCISGHLHLTDRLTYNGIDFLGSGAASGNWWNSQEFKQTECGFSVFDLYPDGAYERKYYTYGWA